MICSALSTVIGCAVSVSCLALIGAETACFARFGA
jgi:hypothetical protein